MDRRAWQATVHGVAESRLSDLKKKEILGIKGRLNIQKSINVIYHINRKATDHVNENRKAVSQTPHTYSLQKLSVN